MTREQAYKVLDKFVKQLDGREAEALTLLLEFSKSDAKRVAAANKMAEERKGPRWEPLDPSVEPPKAKLQVIRWKDGHVYKYSIGFFNTYSYEWVFDRQIPEAEEKERIIIPRYVER